MSVKNQLELYRTTFYSLMVLTGLKVAWQQITEILTHDIVFSNSSKLSHC